MFPLEMSNDQMPCNLEESRHFIIYHFFYFLLEIEAQKDEKNKTTISIMVLIR
jgi:hypothetical protein